MAIKEESNIDIIFGYEDDIIIAGNYKDVSKALSSIQNLSLKIDLELKISKCELIPISHQNHDFSLFPKNLVKIMDGNFEYLGAPIGCAKFCNDFILSKVEKLKILFQKISEIEDPQISYFLLKNCASFGKLVFSTRVTPPDFHINALDKFDMEVRACFEDISGIHCDKMQWNRACLSTKRGGLGFRETKTHAYAAYIASVTSCLPKCRTIDEYFYWNMFDDNSHLNRSIKGINTLVMEKDRIIINDDSNFVFKQGVLSDLIDDAKVLDILSNSSLVDRAHFNLENAPKAGAWLNTLPCESLGHKIPGVLFTIMLKRRLRVNIFNNTIHCNLCDQIMDKFGDHAICCSAGGDRNFRHNALRNKAFTFCELARLNPEMEKIGLLRTDSSNRLRPADIYIPSLKVGQQSALDFAVTSGLKSDLIEHSCINNRFATEEYSTLKKNSLNMNEQCERNDLRLIPMVIEASAGSWGLEAENVWKILIKAIASTTGDKISMISSTLYQSLSITLHKSNARAILKRSPITPKLCIAHEEAGWLLSEKQSLSKDGSCGGEFNAN